jgi:methionyl-tRNA formyltransferase
MTKSSVIFFGSADYSNLILEKLISLPDFNLLTVVTKPDKPQGRHQIVTPNPVAQFCHTHHLPLLQPSDFTPDFINQFRQYQPNLALVVAYGPPFFTPEMINIPTHKIINVHPSPLPKYRGATPGPWQIINGETTSAVTFFQLDDKPDHGPIISQLPLNITSTDTADSFYQRAFSLAASKLQSVLSSYLQNPRNLAIQDHSQKSYYPKFTKDMAQIDWSWEPVKINRFIRALQPWPIAWTLVKNSSGRTFKMKVFSSTFDFQTLDFKPEKVQIEGKSPTSWSSLTPYYTLIK